MHPKLYDTLSKYDTIILVGGGTGGHIQPILNLLEKGGGLCEAQDGGLVRKLLWIGGKDSNEEVEAKKANIDFKSISTLKLATTLSPKVILYPFILLKGIIEARGILGSVTREQVKQSSKKIGTTGLLRASQGQEQVAIFSKGGPGSVAIGIAAWTLRIPLYIHESDTIPGRSNRILGKFATRIFLGFESAMKYFDSGKTEVIGQILHPVFSSLRKEVARSDGGLGDLLEKGGGIRIANAGGLADTETPIPPAPLSQGGKTWKTSKPHILVICGSQGAKSIFEAIIAQFRENNPYEWIIALGKLNSDMKDAFAQLNTSKPANQQTIQAFDWISQEDIAHLIQGADIAITRGSATTLAEIDAFGVKKIIVPLPHSADNHQYWNAKEYEKKGDILLEQKNLGQLKDILKEIGQNSEHSSISSKISST